MNDIDTGKELNKKEVEDVVITAYCVYQDILGRKKEDEKGSEREYGYIEDRFRLELIGKEDGIEGDEEETERVEVEEIFKRNGEVEEVFKAE